MLSTDEGIEGKERGDGRNRLQNKPHVIYLQTATVSTFNHATNRDLPVECKPTH